ncbi:hypothetical protein BJI48_07980 [Helicobacter sp. 11S02596-1]|nr:hypothetical protein BJI48_07980 [Helicobacter sp. 11S02596-1]
MLAKSDLWIGFLRWFYNRKVRNSPFSVETSDYLGDIYGMMTGIHSNILKKSIIYPLSEVTFEGHIFKAPNNTDMHLREMYGDYMQLPPEEERIGKHLPAYMNLDLPYEDFDYSMIEKG